MCRCTFVIFSMTLLLPDPGNILQQTSAASGMASKPAAVATATGGASTTSSVSTRGGGGGASVATAARGPAKAPTEVDARASPLQTG